MMYLGRIITPHIFASSLLIIIWISYSNCNYSSSSTAQPLQDSPSFFDWTKSSKPQQVDLYFNRDTLITRMESEERMDAEIWIKGRSVPIRISPRGQTRKKICDFPPLHFSIADSIDLENNWTDYGKYKVVNYCMQIDSQSQLVGKEHLAYQFAQILLPVAFETQLCEVRYIAEFDTLVRHSFIIENEKELAARLQALPVSSIPTMTYIDRETYQRITLFQYMIGNTDWNLTQGHNIEFIEYPDDRGPVPVLYDFDVSGLVNAPYARPHENLPIRNVRERFFQYRGKKTDDFAVVIAEFHAKKEALYEIVYTANHLTDVTKTEVLSYLQTFFDIIEQSDWKELLFEERKSI